MPTENQVSLQQSTVAMWNLEGSNMPIWTWNLRVKFPAALVESLPHRIKTVLKTKGIKLGSICCSWLIIHTCTWHLRPVLQPVGRVVFLRKSCVFAGDSETLIQIFMRSVRGVCLCVYVFACMRVVRQMRPLLCRKCFFFSLNHIFKSPQICF